MRRHPVAVTGAVTAGDEVEPVGPVLLPLDVGDRTAEFELWYFDFGSGGRWIAAFHGEPDDGPVKLRIESACVFGHVFGSAKCDCGYQLNEALAVIAREPPGIVIYGLDQDARGLGVEAHFRIYVMRQQEQLDTAAVYERLDAPVDARDYTAVIAILQAFDVAEVRLLSNNPRRADALEEAGISATVAPLEAPLDVHNMGTLMLEKEDLGYTWQFRTHGDRLTELQRRVEGDAERCAAALVAGTERVIAEYEGDEWTAAEGLRASVSAPPPELGVVYVTDLPRRDELEVYARLGARVVVAPFALLPAQLVSAARELGIKLQDWARENAYRTPRAQWEPVLFTDARDVYRRGERLRIVFRDATDGGVLERYRDACDRLDPALRGALATVERARPGTPPWLELGPATDPDPERLSAARIGIVVALLDLGPQWAVLATEP